MTQNRPNRITIIKIERENSLAISISKERNISLSCFLSNIVKEYGRHMFPQVPVLGTH
ncbi:MAG TPA: hypothetical protein VIY08_00315 [Candidatus Nitrosocosmicus sp.]